MEKLQDVGHLNRGHCNHNHYHYCLGFDGLKRGKQAQEKNEANSRKKEEAHRTKNDRLTKCFAPLFCAALHLTRLQLLASGAIVPIP